MAIVQRIGRRAHGDEEAGHCEPVLGDRDQQRRTPGAVPDVHVGALPQRDGGGVGITGPCGCQQGSLGAVEVGCVERPLQGAHDGGLAA